VVVVPEVDVPLVVPVEVVPVEVVPVVLPEEVLVVPVVVVPVVVPPEVASAAITRAASRRLAKRRGRSGLVDFIVEVMTTVFAADVPGSRAAAYLQCFSGLRIHANLDAEPFGSLHPGIRRQALGE
jgi:hypothetical protein